MTTHATGTFDTKSWEEEPYHEIEGAGKLTRASVTDSFKGDIEGEGRVEYLMAYRDDSFGSFIGLGRVVGRVGDRTGSFVLQHTGTFENGGVRATWAVVPGSGAGELSGLRGEGGYVWDGQHDRPTPFTLEYDLG